MCRHDTEHMLNTLSGSCIQPCCHFRPVESHLGYVVQSLGWHEPLEGSNVAAVNKDLRLGAAVVGDAEATWQLLIQLHDLILTVHEQMNDPTGSCDWPLLLQ